MGDGTEIKCMCSEGQINAKRLQCKNGKNQGRWFYTCPFHQQDDPDSGCRFFQWEDTPPVTPKKPVATRMAFQSFCAPKPRKRPVDEDSQAASPPPVSKKPRDDTTNRDQTAFVAGQMTGMMERLAGYLVSLEKSITSLDALIGLKTPPQNQASPPSS